jgi:uncharacterized protein YfaT (DUF1175 family)
MLPEAHLWTHVMIQAMKDLEAPSLSKTPKGRRAARWFASSNEDIGTFVWVCHLINMDPTFIRSAVRKGKGFGRSRLRRWS